MYDLFGDKFDLNHDGKLSAAEHMMDFSTFHNWVTEEEEMAKEEKHSKHSDFDTDYYSDPLVADCDDFSIDEFFDCDDYDDYDYDDYDDEED